MTSCVTKGCKGLTGLICDRGWFHCCPVCGAVSPASAPRTPDKADRLTAEGLSRLQADRFSEAEKLFLSAAGSTGDPDRRIFCLWMSLLARYGVSYVEEVQFATIPARRTSLFLPVFGRFPLPDPDIRATRACRELEQLLKQRPVPGLKDLLDELAVLLDEIRDCLKSPVNRNDVFIAWHDRPEGGPCAAFADRLNSQLALSKECYSFVSFRDLRQHSVDHYEPHIYAALAAARVMVIIVDDYDALGQKFLQSEVQRFLRRKQQDPSLRLYFCGMKGHTGRIPAYLKEQGLECHREDAEDSDLCAQLVRSEVLAILREQRAAKARHAAASGQQPDASAPAQAGTDLRKPAAPRQAAAGQGTPSAPQTAAPGTPDPIPAGLTEGLARVQFDMANKRWDKALERLGDLQEQYPTRSDPYLYMLLCRHQCQDPAGLGLLDEAFENSVNWRFALQYADPARKRELDSLLADSRALRKRREEERQRVEQERLATERRVAEQLRQEEEEAFRQEQERRRREQEKKRIAAEKRRQREAEFTREKQRQDQINDPLRPFGLYCEFAAESVTLKRLPENVRTARQRSRSEDQAGDQRQHTAAFRIPDCVTHIGYRAFEGFTALKTIRIPDSVISIGESAFAGCAALEDLTLPAGLLEIEDFAFGDCPALTALELPDGLTHLGMGAFADCTALGSVIIPGTVKEIDEEAFAGCTSLDTVIIEDGVEGIWERAFADCSTRQCIRPCKIHVPASVRFISDNAFARTGFAPFAKKGLAMVTAGSAAERYFHKQPFTVSRMAGLPEGSGQPAPKPDAKPAAGKQAKRRKTSEWDDEELYEDWDEFID